MILQIVLLKIIFKFLIKYIFKKIKYRNENYL